MKVLSKGCYKGSRQYNGDIIGCLDNMWYVIDGSTAVFNDNNFFDTSDLYEYMQLLNKEIKSESGIISDLKMAIVHANEKLVGVENYKEYELPTFTIAVVRENKTNIEVYQLCDTLISILYKDGHIENIEDRRIDIVKDVCRNRRNEIKNMIDITEEERNRLLLENEQVTRMKVNCEGGFPVGSTDPLSILNGCSYVLKKDDIDKILICSDGLYDSSDEKPSSISDFDVEILEEKVEELLKKDKRDDLSYILIQV